MLDISHFRGHHYSDEKKIQGRNNQFAQESEKSQNGLFHSGSTANRLAEQYNISHITIKRNANLAEAINSIGEASPEAKGKYFTAKCGSAKTA